MTSDDSGTVDIDLLADYIGGALDGAEQAEVARLVATDPQWRETYELLAPGMDAVSADLSAYGSVAETMPADVAARLDAALAGPAAALTTIDESLAAPVEPHLEPSPTTTEPSERHLSLVPSDPDAPKRAHPRPRRRLRWAAPIAVAAGVIAFAGFGVSQLTESQTSADSSAAGSAAENAPAPMMGNAGALAALPPDDQIVASGKNYNAVTSEELQRALKSSDSQPEITSSGGSTDAANRTPATLSRLQSSRDALLACLEAIAQENGKGPIQVQTVDFARFKGSPAVMVTFLSDSVTNAWAVGPDCGASGAGANRL